MKKIALILKENKNHNSKVIRFLKSKKIKLDIFVGKIGDKLPLKLKKKKYDIIISYLSPWIITNNLLNKTKLYNINFHPGPPNYPGIGCYNFAIYNQEKFYGVTAHIMNSKVDTGKILGVKKFKINKHITLDKLINLSYLKMYELFKDIVNKTLKNELFPNSNISWTRKPYKRIDLENLCLIKKNYKKNEILKRIRSTYYPGYPGPYFIINDRKFEYNPKR